MFKKQVLLATTILLATLPAQAQSFGHYNRHSNNMFMQYARRYPARDFAAPGIINVTPFGNGYTVWGGSINGIINVTPFGNGYTVWGGPVNGIVNVTPFGNGYTIWGPGIEE
jgi:putative transposon-encoded protein